MPLIAVVSLVAFLGPAGIYILVPLLVELALYGSLVVSFLGIS